MLLFSIDSRNKVPIYQQILNQLIQLIEKNALKPGDRLPSTRNLASQYELNRNTVYKAYQELWSLGYIESMSGSYSIVRARKKTTIKKNIDDKPSTNWDKLINSSSKLLIKQHSKKISEQRKCFDFTALSPDPRLSPTDDIRKCFNVALKSVDGELLNYANEYGYYPLKKIISENLQRHGVDITNSEIVITNGAQHALELIIKLFIEPGSEVIVESPTYSSIIPMLRYYKAQIIEIPVNNYGIDLKILSQKLKSSSPKFLYTMPNFQNPTGITTAQSHREKLMMICEKHQLPIIEDGFVEEMKYFGRNFLPLKSLDTQGLVFYVGTFSKVLFPGLRIGWIASNEYFTHRFAEQIKASLISINQLSQAALEVYCSKGMYEKQLRKMHSVYRKRMTMALKILRESLKNKNVKYTKPLGGYLLWFEVEQPEKLTEAILVQRISEQGVKVTPGKDSFNNAEESVNFRISIAHLNESEIEAGLYQLIKILNKL